jgi:hypothetical protein
LIDGQRHEGGTQVRGSHEYGTSARHTSTSAAGMKSQSKKVMLIARRRAREDEGMLL